VGMLSRSLLYSLIGVDLTVSVSNSLILSTQNDSMSGGGGGGGGAHPQSSHFAEHQLSYFDQGTSSRTQPHSLSGGVHESGTLDPPPHPIKSTEGSPPPTSATTSGSTSTPTSGESSGGDGKHGEQHHHHVVTAPHFHQPIHSQTNEAGWSVSVGHHGMIPQPYRTDAGDPSISHDGGYVDPSTADSHAARYNNAAPYASAIKLLVSNNVAGSIIGRAGQTISELQTQSSARIKLSQTGDYYPGTQDRVCLVQGNIENVKLAVQLLLERLHMLQEQQHSQHASWQSKQEEGVGLATKPMPQYDFNFVVRVLVPSSSCGMIIGKAGANIKHMEESSGVSSVRLSPKECADPGNPTAAIVSGTGERVVTLTGASLDCCVKCVSIIIDGMSANQEISRYTNMTTSYSRIIIPGTYAPMAPPGRPMIVVPTPTAEWDAQGHYSQFSGKRSSSQPDLTQTTTMDAPRAPPRLPPGSPKTGSVSPAVAHQRDTMQHFSSSAFHDGSPPFGTDAGSMMAPSPPTTTRGLHSNTGGGPMYLVPTGANAPVDHSAMSQSSSAPDLLALQFQDSVRVSNQSTASSHLDYSQFAPQHPQPTPPGFTAQVLVPDTLVGSILGRGGRALNDLQMHSNTRIRISQRGEYMPGTRNRIVTIRGPTAHSVSLAQYLMSQRMVLPPTANFSPQAAASASTVFHHPAQLQPPNRFPPQHGAPSQHAMAPLPSAPTALPHSLHLHHHQQSPQPLTHPFSDSAFLPTSSSATAPADSQASASAAPSSLSMTTPQGGSGPNDLTRS
jgi:KH domain